jgi:hypothetical protein
MTHRSVSTQGWTILASCGLTLALLGGCEERIAVAPAPTRSPARSQVTPSAPPRGVEVPLETPSPIAFGGSPLATGSAEAVATSAEPVEEIRTTGEPPSGEALERARAVVKQARAVIQARSRGRGPVSPGVVEALFSPNFDHHGPALDLRGQCVDLGIQPAPQEVTSRTWYLRAKAYGFAPALPEQESGWRYRRLAVYGLGGEVMNTDRTPADRDFQPAEQKR